MFGRQLRRGARDRRLHVLRRAVNVAAQIELQGDLRAAERAGRGHRVDAGNRRELLFQRRRDGRGHGVGVRAGQSRAYT